MKSPRTIPTAIGIALVASACGASKPSEQLQDARARYTELRSSEAVRTNPRDVHLAHEALERAEGAYEEDAGSTSEQHLAYLAERRAQIALARSEKVLAQNRANQAQNQYEDTLQNRLKSAKNEKEQTREQLNETQASLSETKRTLAEREAALEEEREARIEAEKAATEAMTRLSQKADVRDEKDNIVITLAGSVLFKTGSATLLPAARNRLDDVATALKGYPDKSIVVEGHTDSRGTDQFNRRLSQDRADSVRTYLVSQGVKSEQIDAEGQGESEPVATNDSPEGRANNRRVEIIVEDAEQRSAQASPKRSSGWATK